MKTKDGIMYMSQVDHSDLAVRGQILNSSDGERVLYNGYAHKIEITCQNNVQFAFNELEAHRKTLENCKTEQSRNEFFIKTETLARGVWYAIAEATKSINPSLKADIERGHYDQWYLHSAHTHFVDANWQIYPRGTKCLHCGEIHHHLLEKDFACGLGYRIHINDDEEPEEKFEWMVVDLKTKEVLASGSDELHHHAIAMAESEIEELAGK